MKTCTACEQAKPFSEFYPRYHKCKDCVRAKNALWKVLNADIVNAGNRRWRKLNPDKARAMSHRWVQSNRDKDNAKHKRFYWRNPEARREKTRLWAKLNPEKAALMTAKRKSATHKAAPKWLSAEDHELMQFLYKEAAGLSKDTGVKFHVDHIVPLRGKTVCGLHAPWNLQIIAAGKNLSKHNKLV